MSAAENREIVRRSLEEGFNNLDLAVIDELGAADYVDHAPIPGQAPGPEGVKQSFIALHSAFPGIRSTIEDMVAEGDRVVVRTTLRGTHGGPFMGLPPTGKEI